MSLKCTDWILSHLRLSIKCLVVSECWVMEDATIRKSLDKCFNRKASLIRVLWGEASSSFFHKVILRQLSRKFTQNVGFLVVNARKVSSWTLVYSMAYHQLSWELSYIFTQPKIGIFDFPGLLLFPHILHLTFDIFHKTTFLGNYLVWHFYRAK